MAEERPTVSVPLDVAELGDIMFAMRAYRNKLRRAAKRDDAYQDKNREKLTRVEAIYHKLKQARGDT